MVDESLRAYLLQQCPDCTDTVDTLLDTDDEPVDTNHAKTLLKALYHCRILYPACGSGAFPMGMLQRMVELLRHLDPDNTSWRKIVEDDAANATGQTYHNRQLTDEERKKRIDDIAADFEHRTANPDYTRKLYLIRNSIHGVDLQNIAIMIAKLRFFISLLSEQHTNKDAADNYGILTLPNLETNLVCANSLIAADFSTAELNDLARLADDDELRQLREQLKKVRDEHFTAKSKGDKQRLEKRDKDLREQIKQHIIDTYRNPLQHNIDMWQQGIAEYQKIIAEHQGSKIELRDEARQTSLFDDADTPRRKRRIDVNLQARNKAEAAIKANRQSIRQADARIQRLTNGAQLLAQWNPYDQIKSSPFFDPEWMFGISAGFDIVIGNPPYIRLENNGGELGLLYQDKGYHTFARTGDIYCLFYERALSLCRAGGATCFITSNKWMRAGYGEATRKYLASKNPKLLVDFGGLQVFESATVDTNILLVQNTAPAGDTLCCTVRGTKSLKAFDLAQYVRDNASPQAFATGEAWTILSSTEQAIRAKIEAAGVPLKDWEVSIYRGVLTGFDDAFIIDTDTRDEILSHCQSKAERERTERLIRKVLRGRDIRRYGYEWAGLWLVWVPWHFPLHMDESIQGASAKAEKEFARQYPAVYAHLLQYKGQLEKRNKAETGIRYEWYAMQRWGANYWQDFDKPKIVYPNMTKFMPFYYDEEQYVTNQKCFILIGKHAAYLTAFFNSSIFKKCFRENFPQLQGGTRELSKIFFDKIPVKQVSDEVNDTFKEAVADIQREYTKAKAIAIDEMLFDLYGLTDEERSAIGFIEIK